MAPADSETTTKFVSTTNANSLKAAIFYTMAFKLSLEINTDQVTVPTKRSFLKVLYNVCKIKKKNIALEQYARIHLDGPKIAICETTSDMVLSSLPPLPLRMNTFRWLSPKLATPLIMLWLILANPKIEKNTTQKFIK